jgi:hypothetical protein
MHVYSTYEWKRDYSKSGTVLGMGIALRNLSDTTYNY